MINLSTDRNQWETEDECVKFCWRKRNTLQENGVGYELTAGNWLSQKKNENFRTLQPFLHLCVCYVLFLPVKYLPP